MIKKSIIEGLYYDITGNIYRKDGEDFIIKKGFLFSGQLYVSYRGNKFCIATTIILSEGFERIGRYIKHKDGDIYNNHIDNISFISKKNICCIDGCDRNCVGKGYCMKHYIRLNKGNNPEDVTIKDGRPSIKKGSCIMIPLGLNAKGGYAIVDEEYQYLDKLKWIKGKNGYAVLSGRKPEYMHHHIIKGYGNGLVVDHINRNKLDNRKLNLRLVTPTINNNNKEQKKGKKYLIDEVEYTAIEYSIHKNIGLSTAYKQLKKLTNAKLPQQSDK